MPAILDLLYREYCRARLAEMRKELLVRVESDEVAEPICGAGHPADAAGREGSLPVDASQDLRSLRR